MSKNWLDPFIKASPVGSQEELADLLDVSRATINRLANDHSKLKLGRAREIALHLGVTADQLMLNRPPAVGADDFVRVPIDEWDPTKPDDSPGQAEAYLRDHYRSAVAGALPEIDVQVGAGQGTVGEVLSLPMGKEIYSGHRVVAEWLFPDGFLRNEAKVVPSQSLVLSVVGDSMVPTYQPGDRVIVDLSQNTLTSDTVYVISDGASEPQIKRLQRVLFSEPAMVRIISDNPALQTDTVELDRLQIIGRVCGLVARK